MLIFLGGYTLLLHPKGAMTTLDFTFNNNIIIMSIFNLL